MSRGCTRSQEAAAAIPYRDVSVLVVTCGSGQVAGSASASSPPCLRGRPMTPGRRAGAGSCITRSARSRPSTSTGRSASSQASRVRSDRVMHFPAPHREPGTNGRPVRHGATLASNDPIYQEKLIKFNQLVANCCLYSTAVDLTDAVNQLIAGGWTIDPDDVATLSPLITSTIRRFGDWHLDLTPPETTGDGRLAVPVDRHPMRQGPTGAGRR